MKKFQFSLEKVMNVKEIEEKILQRKLLSFEKSLIDAEENQKSIEIKINEEWNRKNCKKQNSNDMMIKYNYINSLQLELEEIIIDIRKIEREVEIARKNLAEKVKEKKTLEKLKENQLEEHLKNYKKKEQQQFDEISMQSNYFRKSK